MLENALLVVQFSISGKKNQNQDAHGFLSIDQHAAPQKGAIAIIADGIISSDVIQIGSDDSVRIFLEDYPKTATSWAVKRSVTQVLQSINQHLFNQNDDDRFHGQFDKTFVCNCSGMVFQENKASIFHIGDSRIYRIRDNAIEQLTRDHKRVGLDNKYYLSEALGFKPLPDFDFSTVNIVAEDIFILATGGLFEYAPEEDLMSLAKTKYPLNETVKNLAEKALAMGSEDNVTLQVTKVNALPLEEASFPDASSLNIVERLAIGDTLDGYEILDVLHSGTRSHVYLVEDETNAQWVMKMPDINLAANEAFLDRLLMEEWVAHQVTSAYVIQAPFKTKHRSSVYTLSEYIEGMTLDQWIVDNPNRTWPQIKSLVEQMAKGLQALHRKNILHQDIRPENIMITKSGTVKIIDLGAAYVEGEVDLYHNTRFNKLQKDSEVLGEMAFMAPEILIGQPSSVRSDLFSLAALTYYLITESLPYGTKLAQLKSRKAQKRCEYRLVNREKKEIPFWINVTLEKALSVVPEKRYNSFSHFLFDLTAPNTYLLNQKKPIIERNPVRFWQSISLFLCVISLSLIVKLLSLL